MLHRREGDDVAYAIEEGRVILTRARADTIADDPFATVTGWSSPAGTEPIGRLPLLDQRHVDPAHDEGSSEPVPPYSFAGARAPTCSR